MRSILADSAREQIFGQGIKSHESQEKAMDYGDISDAIRGNRIKDETIDEYIEQNPALQRYLGYSKEKKEKQNKISRSKRRASMQILYCFSRLSISSAM